jgi:hypothetical protein
MIIFIDCGTNFKQGLNEIKGLHPEIEKTYSFEANTHVFDLLDKNDGNTYMNMAVSDKNGTATFYAERCIKGHSVQGNVIAGEDRYIGGGSRLQDPKYGVSKQFNSNIPQTIGDGKKTNNIDEFVEDMYDAITVPTIRLVDFINSLNVDDKSIILKLDIEGTEYSVLEDMKKSNIFNKIKILHVEWHEWARTPDQDSDRVWIEFFNKNGVKYTSRGIVI